jgi:hypothetical protein
VRRAYTFVALRVFSGLCTILIASACIVDEGARCGDDRILGEQETCVCPPGTADSAKDKTCQPIIITDAGAPEPERDAAVEDGAAADAGQEDGAAMPTGIGTPCSSHADCASFDATYCESFQSHQCLIEGCAVSPDDCPTDYECCDLSSFGLENTLCVPDGQCPTR